MKNRYYVLNKDNSIDILATVEDGDTQPLVAALAFQPPDTTILNDSDLYKLIAQATEALNTKPY